MHYLDEADQLASRIVIIDHGRAVANGTPDELKRRIGGNVIEVRVRRSEDLAKVAESLGRFDHGGARIDEATRRVTAGVAAADAGEELTAALHSVQSVGVAIEDVALRQPTLDEVFLALTGQPRPEPPERTIPMATIAATLDRDRGRGPATLATSTLAVARRALPRYPRTPQLLVVGTIQMAGFLLVYRYVFGGAIRTPDIPYVDFLIPGFVTTGVLFTGIGAAVAMAEDLQQGFIDRLRSLPIPRSSVLIGRTFADTAIAVWSLAVTVVIAFLIGFRLHGTVWEGIAAFALIVAFGYAFEWLFITVGMFAGSAQAAQGYGLLVFPFTFVSSAYVPVSSMPGWLQVFAKHQPLTSMIDAVRALTLGPSAESLLGHPAAYFVTRSLVWTVAIIAVCLPLAVVRYRRG